MSQTIHTRRVVINADDYGFSPGITEGILRAHRDGIVTSTTIAANMPAAAEAARRLAEAPNLGVGVHLNVSQGPPLSKEALRLADEDGVLRLTAVGVILACVRSRRALLAVEAEYDAQIRWALDHGIRPTHLDSHRHAHGFPPILKRVVRLARRYNVPCIRWLWEKLPPGGWTPGPAKQRRTRRLINGFAMVNRWIGSDLRVTQGTWGIEHTGCIDAAWLVQAARGLPPGVTEIMTHPGLADETEAAASRLGERRQAELAALCDPAVRATFETNGIQRVHYGHLHRSD